MRGEQALPSHYRHILCAMPSQLICSTMVPICGSCNCFWATPIFQLRRSIRMWRASGLNRFMRYIIQGGDKRFRECTGRKHIGTLQSLEKSAWHILTVRIPIPYRDSPDKRGEYNAQHSEHYLLPGGGHHQDGTAK